MATSLLPRPCEGGRVRPVPDGGAAFVRTRQIEGLAENQGCRPDGPRLVAPHLNLDVQIPAEIRKRLLTHRTHNRVKKRASKGRAFTADDEQFGIEQRDDVGNRHAQLSTRAVDHLERRTVSQLSEKLEFVARNVMALALTDATTNGAFADHRLQATESTAFALGSARLDDHVSEFAAGPVGASIQRPIDNDSQADPASDRQGKEVASGEGVAGPLLGDCQGVDVVFNPHG